MDQLHSPGSLDMHTRVDLGSPNVHTLYSNIVVVVCKTGAHFERSQTGAHFERSRLFAGALACSLAHAPARSLTAAMAEGARCTATIEADVAPGTPIDPNLTTSLLDIVKPQVVWLRVLYTLELEDIILATDRAKACEACLNSMRERVCAEYRYRADRLSVRTLEEQLDAAKARLQESMQAEVKAERQVETLQQLLQEAEEGWEKAAKKASAAGGGTVSAEECAVHGHGLP
jgi:succinate dehydrogenase/fumarate reductase flavoprotein subunit